MYRKASNAVVIHICVCIESNEHRCMYRKASIAASICVCIVVVVVYICVCIERLLIRYVHVYIQWWK
jgi:hypothetical protein